MKPTTENKIELCRWCLDALTSSQKKFCSDECGTSYADHNTAYSVSSAHQPIDVYCNLPLLNLCRGQHVRPYDFSGAIYTGSELVVIATFARDELAAIGDTEMRAYGVWYREIPETPGTMLNEGDREMGFSDIKKIGLIRFLSSRGYPSEKQVAMCIGTICKIQGCTPVELLNSL